jgi:hypothetical protein
MEKTKNSVVKKQFDIDIDILEQQNYTENKDIQNSFLHFQHLEDNEKQLITDYKSEMDPDDWVDKPLQISYPVVNWLTQQKSRKLAYVPELLESNALSEEQLMDQIHNASKLISILSSFPKLKNSINVYRGDTNDTCKFIKVKMHKKQITLHTFLSTSMNISVATNFSKGCLLCISIPSGYSLPFISDKLTTNYSSNISESDTSESEVLLPLGSSFKLLGIYHNIVLNGKELTIYHLQLISFGHHNTRNLWSDYEKLSKRIYSELHVAETMSPKSNSKTKSKSRKRMKIKGGFTKKYRSNYKK